MLMLLVAKEIQKRFYDLRFFLLLAVSLVMGITATAISMREYRHRHGEYVRLRSQAEQQTTLDRTYVVKPPNPLLFIRDGEQDAPILLKMEPAILHYVESADTTERPPIETAIPFDWAFLIVYVYSFLAVLMTYDSVVGEKQSGTLPLVLAGSCRRWTVILACFIGNVVVLWVPLLLTVGLSLLMILLVGQIELGAREWLRIGIALMLSGLFITIMGAVGLFASTVFYRASTALVVSLILWIGMVIVFPNGVRLAVESWGRVPSLHELQENLEGARRVKWGGLSLSGELLWAAVTYPGLTESQREKLIAAVQAKTYADHEQVLEKFAVTTGQILASYHREVSQQAERIRLFSRFSPAFSYQFALEGMIPAGYVRHAQFLAAAERYLDSYTTVARRLRQLLRPQARVEGGFTRFTYKGKVYQLNGIEKISYAHVPFDRSQLPRFRMPLPSLSEAAVGAAWDILALILWTGLLFVGTCVAFLRYDVRA